MSPTPLSRTEVRRLAALARLPLTPAEESALAEQLGTVLAHVDQLRLSPPALAGAADPDAATPLRPDEVGDDPLRRGPAELAPAWDGSCFVVPLQPALERDGGPGAA